MELPFLTIPDVILDAFTDPQEAVNSFFPDRAIQRFDILQFVQEQNRSNRAPVPQSAPGQPSFLTEIHRQSAWGRQAQS
jgi:hypothetical protein